MGPRKATGPVALTDAVVSQQRALHDDANKRLEQAFEERAAAEEAHSKAEAEHAAAQQASAAKRDDDALVDAAARATVRLGHARADLSRAIESHTQVSADLEACKGRVSLAEKANELARIIDEQNDGSHEFELFEHGRAIADGLADIKKHIGAVRSRLRNDANRVARARELGGADLHAPDGLSAASGFLSALADQGAALVNGYSLDVARWALALPTTFAPDADAAEAVRSLLSLSTNLREQGELQARDGKSHGREELRRVSALWGAHRTYQTARAAVEAASKAADVEREAANALEHQKRLARIRGDSSPEGINRRLRRESKVWEQEPPALPPRAEPTEPPMPSRFASPEELEANAREQDPRV